MRKKQLTKLREKSLSELEKDLLQIQKQVVQLELEKKVNIPKDSNTISKLKRERAIIKTMITQMSVANKTVTNQ